MIADESELFINTPIGTVLKAKGIFESLYGGFIPDESTMILLDSETDQYTKQLNVCPILINDTDVSDELINQFDEIRQTEWFMPDEYKAMNLEQYFKPYVTEKNADRISLELKLYEENNMNMLLRYLIYLREVTRKEGIVLGIGRGSSCASYLLYLVGINKVDPLKYNINISEFFKNYNGEENGKI